MPLKPGMRTSSTRQAGPSGLGLARNSRAEVKVWALNPADRMSRSVVRRTDRSRHYLEVPADWFLDLLAKHFGRPISLLLRAAPRRDQPQTVPENDQVKPPTISSASDSPQQT